jgi:hypothetical protein
MKWNYLNQTQCLFQREFLMSKNQI